MNTFVSHEEVVGLACHETHVYHPKCLISYLEAVDRFECLLCDEKIVIAKPDEEELIFSGNIFPDPNHDSLINQSLTSAPSNYTGEL